MNLLAGLRITLDRGQEPHRSNGPTPWDSYPAPVYLDAGKLKLSNQAGRELEPRITKLVVRHWLPGTTGEDAQQMLLLIVKWRGHPMRYAIRFCPTSNVPNLRRRKLAIV
ncbi:MAG TPA: hypothetical protein VGL78_05510 [Solirubrobacteraceae bacterium]